VYHPAAFAVGKRDMIGAWLVCLVVAVACLGFIDVLSRRSPGRAGLDKARPNRAVMESSAAGRSPNRLSYGCPARIFLDILAALLCLFWLARASSREGRIAA
jgi:hypothetical protein